jgi:hypothetical protein
MQMKDQPRRSRNREGREDGDPERSRRLQAQAPGKRELGAALGRRGDLAASAPRYPPVQLHIHFLSSSNFPPSSSHIPHGAPFIIPWPGPTPHSQAQRRVVTLLPRVATSQLAWPRRGRRQPWRRQTPSRRRPRRRAPPPDGHAHEHPPGLVALLCSSLADGGESCGNSAPMATPASTLRCSIRGLSLFSAASSALPSPTETELAASTRRGKRGRRRRGGGEEELEARPCERLEPGRDRSC